MLNQLEKKKINKQAEISKIINRLNFKNKIKASYNYFTQTNYIKNKQTLVETYFLKVEISNKLPILQEFPIQTE